MSNVEKRPRRMIFNRAKRDIVDGKQTTLITKSKERKFNYFTKQWENV